MKKGIKLACKILSVFLSVLLVVQIAPMQVIADAYVEATVNENTENTLGVNLDDIDTTDPEAEILAEETSKREQYVKHFRMSDGSHRAAQYEVPVHFIKDDKWTDYDNTLVEVDADTEEGETASNKDLTNVLADYSVRLSKKTNGKKFVRIEKNGYKLSWYYINANKVTAQITEITDDGDDATLEKLSSQVIYEEVYENTDFEYIVGSEGLKENIILKSEDTLTEFVAEYKANGLNPVQVNDKTIELRADDGTVIYTINAPYMTDANMEYSDGITLTLSNVKNNKFTVTTTLDEDWLNNNDRAYPVTVDPHLTTSQEWEDEACTSAYIASSTPSTCYGRNGNGYEGSLYVGYTNDRGKTRSLIKMTELPELGVADKVIYAEMAVWVYACYPELIMNLHNVTKSWNSSSVCWNSDITYDSEIIDYQVVQHIEETDTAAKNRWQHFEVTDLVRGWYSGEIANNGVLLRSDKETSTTQARARMFSTDYPTFATVRPVFVIHYRNMSGYEDYWSYTGVSAGRGGAASVNNFNGNFVFSQPITNGDGGNLMPVALSLVYNSNGITPAHSLVGEKMKTNFHISMHVNNVENVEECYKYYMDDADGTRHWFYFENNSDTSGKDEDGLGYTIYELKNNPDPICEKARYKITDKDNNKLYFTSQGYLRQITDSNGNSIIITYEEVNSQWRMKTIADGAERKYTFNYENTSNTNLCTSITDPAGRKVSFTYSSGNMTRITYPDNKYVELEYYDSGLMKIIRAIDAMITKVTYDNTSQKRVTNIKCGTSGTNLLESYSFAYKQNETKITDLQEREYTYQFNNFGQTTGIVSNDDGKAQYFDYTAPTEKDSPNANKLVSQSKVIYSVINYVVNSDVEDPLSGTYIIAKPSTATSSTVTLDETKGNLTKNSIKVYKPASSTDYVYAYQEFSNLAAGTYTFSCYVNTYGETATGQGVHVGYRTIDANGNVTKNGATEPIMSTDGWERVSVTFNVDNGEKVRIVTGFSSDSLDGAGTAWFDDYQLEKNPGPSSYNLLDNSGFTNGKTDWSNTATLTTLSNNELPGFTKAISKVGSPTEEWLGLSQFVYPSNGKKGDVFSIGSWIKADSAPINNLKDNGEGEADDDRYKPRFALALHFYNTSGTCIGTEEIKVNDDLNTWQFVSGKVIAPVNYSYCCFEVIYYSNINTVMMTGGFCHREEFGQTYTYDEDGNVISSVDLANVQSNFVYYGSQMAKMLNPSGSRYIYAHDSNGRLTYALSSSGLQYGFTYDDKGNVTKTQTDARKPALELENGKEYYLVNAYSGKSLYSDTTGVAGDDVYTINYKPTSTYQKWRLEAVSGQTDVYKIIPVAFSDSNLCLNVASNSSTAGGVIELCGRSNSSAQKFKITKQSDGTFVITTGSSDYALAFDAQYSGNDIEGTTKVKQNSYSTSNPKESVRWYFYPVEKTVSRNIVTTATYTNNKNFVSTQTDQRGNVTTYNYNENKGTLTSSVDPSGNTTSYSYNANTNALTSVSSGGMTNSYAYTNDRLSTINVNGGTRYKFLYDSFGRTTATQVGNGTTYHNLSTLTYNTEGLLSKQTYGNGDFISFTYDNLDRLIGKSYNNSSTNKAEYYYGADGNISLSVDYSTNTKTKYVYDLSGRLVSTRDYVKGRYEHLGAKSYVEYTYADKTNYLTGVKHYSELGTQNIEYTYGKLSSGYIPDHIYIVDWNDKTALRFYYDDLGRLTGKVHGKDILTNPFRTYYSYVDVGSTRTTSLVKEISYPEFDIDFNYNYDTLGNITSIVKNDGKTVSYEYDNLNQLVRENNPYRNKTHTYEYENGNMTYYHVYDYTTGNLPSTPLYTVQFHYNNATWSDVVTKKTKTVYNSDGTTTVTNTTITSDAIGNITKIGSTSYGWTGRRLDSIGSNITYKYNIDGQRVKKTVSGVTTEYYYNGSILAGQKTGNNKMVFMYDNNGDAFGFIYNNATYYYAKNTQNDVIGITDSTGTLVASYRYDAWGNIILKNDKDGSGIVDINPIRYRSYYYDTESEMYYLNSRYYIPSMGRFLCADGICDTNSGMLSHNMFAYCNNNPVNMIDSEGTGPIWNLLKNATKKIYKIITGKEYEKQGVAKTTFNTTKTIIKSVDSYGDACNNARQDYITNVENVVNYNNNKEVELKAFNNTKLKLNPESYYAKRAYQGLYVYALSEGYDLKTMTWEDVQNHPKLEEDLIGIYCIWDQATVNSIATVYGVDWSVDQGSSIFFN